VKTRLWRHNQAVQRRFFLYLFVLCLFVLAATLFLLADSRPFVPPQAAAPQTYPAHESHDDEKVAIAIDPFDMPDKAKIFRVKYRDKGFLPIRVIIANDSDGYLSLNDLKIEYITVKRAKLEPARNEDILRRLVNTQQRPDKPGMKLPIPIPGKKKTPINKDDAAEVESAQFVMAPLDPHSRRDGFLFFDIQGIETPEAGAHIYFSGLKAGGKELFYFDIPLEKYLTAR
jgi:hypothetical protein